MNVPLLDLKAQYGAIKAEVLSAMEAVCPGEPLVTLASVIGR